MKKFLNLNKILLPITLVIVLMTTMMVGCNKSGTTGDTSTVSLTVVNGDQTKTFTMSQLKALTTAIGNGGILNSAGNITTPEQFKGVAFTTLLDAVGGITADEAVRISAKDGYTMTVSYNQIMNGEFTTFDSALGKEATATRKTLIVAYEESNAAISDDNGPLRTVILSDNGTVTEGHWWVKWTTKLEIIPAPTAWNLNLIGAITDTVSSTTYQSCVAPGCHGTTWTDSDNKKWTGVPLWRFVGSVDDSIVHDKGLAFNDDLAAAGYTVKITAADGFSKSFASADVKRNDNWIVAYQIDGAALPAEQFPLRLVGTGLTKGQMVSQINTIELVFGTTSTTAATTATTTTFTETSTVPDTTVVLTVTRGSQQTKTYTMTQIKQLTAITGSAMTISKANVISGPNQYRGVDLLTLLKAVGGIVSTSTVKVTASDNYAKTFTYAQIMDGSFTTYDKTGKEIAPVNKNVVFLAYEKDGVALDSSTGPLQLGVLTGDNQAVGSSNWVKMTVKIEIITP